MKYVETTSYTVTLQEIGIRDFPDQMGVHAPLHPPAPPNSISYAGNASGAPASANFRTEAGFGVEFLMKMWDDGTKTLYYQVGNSQDWDNFPGLLSDYDIWRLPQADDDYQGCPIAAHFICHRPVFIAGPAGSPISPNLAGRLAAAFAVGYQLNRTGHPDFANRCLKDAEDIFALATRLMRTRLHRWAAARAVPAACSRSFRLTDIRKRYGTTTWSWARRNFISRCSLPAGICRPGCRSPIP
jgi:hypothetical protein